MSKKKIFVLTFLILLFLGLLLGGIFGFRYLKGNYFNSLKTDNGRINFLLLGMNGSGGVDKDLTDTIIFASLNINQGKAILLSIPRDIWIEEIKAKINASYHYGGIDLAKKTLSEVLGQPIHYYAVLNFDSFEKIIDFLGGIEIDVERTFDDLKYPVAGMEKDLCNGDKFLKCRYEALHFEAGIQTMDGKTALKFVRSRNASGVEGNDFARSARQQKVLLAIKNKLTNPDFFKDSENVLEFGKLLQKEILTDVKPDIYGSLGLVGYDLEKKGVSVEMTSLNGNLLINPKYHYSRQWVLVPKNGEWKEIWEYVQKLLE